ncbi:cell wall assembly protein [Paenibacillus sp. LC-T2]|uniref:Cell wall assembly protein n=2 Tax=Paenibacillus monticola TaxID=2666075 RepID=A0A7X2H5U7_9BACL|nr:SMI1/KNR4 family protein [Paenibacillus monticola]MRN53998.1 cell wall assembly protein [Paenibacillus monticola]
MSDDLMEQLDLWHEEDEYQEIVDAIMEIPPEDRDYVLISHLGRAFNNLGNYEEALQQFMTIAEEGKEDPLWHYRVGVSYYYLEQYDEALREFKITDEMDPEDEDTLEFLEWIRRKTAKRTTKKPAKEALRAFDFSNFWDDSEYALEEYVSEPPTAELIESVEEELVFKLPAFYVAMMKLHNGGIPQNTSYPTGAEDYISISGIRGIGRDKKNSLCGASGSRVVIETGGYPEIGVVICDCSSADHGVVMLDYRSSGNDGEPEVVHVGQEKNHKITKLAKNYETFIRGLVSKA